MDMKTDDRKELRGLADFRKLTALLEPLVGLPCLRAAFTYGDELEIHFGTATSYHDKRLSDEKRGSWVLEVLTSPWLLTSSSPEGGAYLYGMPPIIIRSETVASQTIGNVLEQLSGSKVESVAIADGTLDLAIEFDNGFLWRLLSKYAEPGFELPLWELLMPFGMFLQVWGEPAPRWSCLRSDTVQAS